MNQNKNYRQVAMDRMFTIKALSYELLPAAKGFIIFIIWSVLSKTISYHSLTLKPPEYKNNGPHITIIKLLSKGFLKCLKPT